MRYNARRIVTFQLQDPEGSIFRILEDIGIWTQGDENRLTILSADKLGDALENNFSDVEDFVRDLSLVC